MKIILTFGFMRIFVVLYYNLPQITKIARTNQIFKIHFLQQKNFPLGDAKKLKYKKKPHRQIRSFSLNGK